MRKPILLVATGAVTTALVVTSVVGSLHNKKVTEGSGANTPAPQGQVVSNTCPSNRYAVTEKTSSTGSYVEGGIVVKDGDPKKALVEFIDQRATGYPSWVAMAFKTLVDPSTNVNKKQKDFTVQCGGKAYLSLEGQKALQTLDAVVRGAEVSTLTTAENTWTSGLGGDGKVVGALGVDDGKEAMRIASANGRAGEMTLACANWHTTEGAVPTGTLPRVPEEPATPPHHDGGDVKVAAPWNGGAARSVDNGRAGYKATPAAKTPQVVANGSGAQAPLPAAAAGGVAHGTTGGANYGGASQPRPSNAPTAKPAEEVKPPAGMEGM
ncbi:hypothetical protein EUA76_02385 [TM7 phylum sp. oral taxon 350]|nr:hypothetical protein EUA76_02385 [TM7 phylum sp. oral taxon 350]